MSWPSDVDGTTIQRVLDTQAFLALEHSGVDVIAQWQSLQLTALVKWLVEHTSWWRDRLGANTTAEHWSLVPILTRFEMRSMVAQRGAAPVPTNHGVVSIVQRSGHRSNGIVGSHYFVSA